jgi:hypothetical protein
MLVSVREEDSSNGGVVAKYDWMYHAVSGKRIGSLDTLKEVESWSAGADWVTMSRDVGGDVYGDGLDWESWHRLQSAKDNDGWVDVKQAEIQGYVGYAFPSCFWGQHATQGELLRASGKTARDAVAAKLRPDNVSRLDVQVTVWGAGTAPELIAACAKQAAGYVKGRKGPIPRVRHISGFGRGDTCYIGSRRSDTFLRVYDKALESKNEKYHDSVRFECELKNERAFIAYGVLNRQVHQEPAAVAIVRDAFLRHGIELPQNIGLTTPYNSYIPPRETNAARTLAWLRTQVGPAMIRLLTEGSTFDEINDALGLGRLAIRDVYVAEMLRQRKIEEELYRQLGAEAAEEFDEDQSWRYTDPEDE